MYLIRRRRWRSSWLNLTPFLAWGDVEVEHGPDEREVDGSTLRGAAGVGAESETEFGEAGVAEIGEV